MNFQTHFTALKDALNSSVNLWQYEVLNGYPDTLKYYPEQWLAYLDQLSPQELYTLDNARDLSSLPAHAFKSWAQDLQQLTKIEKFKVHEEHAPIPKKALLNIKLKKQHELNYLKRLFKQYKIPLRFTKMLDIGGGMGHTSRIFSHFGGPPCICLEKDQGLIDRGREKLKNLALPTGAQAFQFCQIEFGNNPVHDKKFFSANVFSLGLHTCGALANKHIQAYLQNPGGGLLNFGCCYGKLENQQEQNLSQFAQQDPLTFEKYALTLATRSHAEMTFDDFLLKQIVKQYRYTLHLYLYEKENQKKFQGLGNTPIKIYREGSFADYVAYNLPGQYTAKDLNQFYAKSIPLVRKLFLANIIRWRFGRIIEQYILTDRCLYLQEHQRHVEMKELFHEHLSPRNIGILAF